MSRSHHEYGYMPRKKLEQIKAKVIDMLSIKVATEKIVCYIMDLLECDKLTEKQFNSLMQVVGVDWRKVCWEPVMMERDYINPLTVNCI